MEIKTDTINEHEIALTITVAWDAVKTEYDDMLKRYAKIPVKGFRNALPTKMVESLYKKQLSNDLTTACSKRLLNKAFQTEQLIPGSPVSITDIRLESGQSFGFKAKFLKMPDFELPDYRHLSLTAQTQEEQLTEISEKLLKLTTVILPDAFIEDELQYFESESGCVTDEERKAAADRVKLMLILKKIASNDGIDVDAYDVEERIKKVAYENEMSIQEVKEFLLHTGGASRLSNFLLAENVLEYIIEINTPNSKSN
jgi:FKBP-type peptidyl-prolyl cis-trans isomerase (trigger factor)